jgi:curli biogenesis system outer membrane secretion channel CsgG
MKHLNILRTALALFAATLASAQTAPGLKKLAISDVKVTPGLLDSASAANRKTSLDRVSQALDSQLIDRVQASRKFEIIGRSDMASLLKEADFAGGKFQVSGVDYLLVTTIDDFQDHKETKTFAALGKTVDIRTVRFATVGKIYDAASGKLIESTNFSLVNSQPDDTSGNNVRSGDLSDALLRAICKEMAEKIAVRVADVIFPARVIAKVDKQVTINRGEGTGVAVGQVWNVFALGQELVDPDTGAVLGREEMQVGKVRITQVNPKTSLAVITEDNGIDKLAVLRLPPEASAAK